MSAAPHILVVDDDPDVRQMITDYLVEFNLRVSSATDSRAMSDALNRGVIDLIILDLRLEQEDGMTLTRELRARSSIPIIIISGRRDDADRIMGLELGADDYLTKPFQLRELLARIRTVLRRTRSQFVHAGSDTPRAYRFSHWELDLRTRRLHSEGEMVELTHCEYDLLMAFLTAPQRVLSRAQLLQLMPSTDSGVFDRSIDVQILRLRRKIEVNPSYPRLIKTERGQGYCLMAKVEAVP